MDYVLYFTIAGSTVFIMLIGFLLGGWLMLKGNRSAKTDESFIGRSPKGEVFSVSDGLDEDEFPDEPDKEEEHILSRTNNFLRSLGGSG